MIAVDINSRKVAIELTGYLEAMIEDAIYNNNKKLAIELLEILIAAYTNNCWSSETKLWRQKYIYKYKLYKSEYETT
jgi:hypothetical protein